MWLVNQPRPCSICFREHQLLMSVGRLDYCPACWREAGEPRPPAAGPLELAAAEVRIRERMLRHGGNHRYLVRSGKA
jgi:hypothetical protein